MKSITCIPLTSFAHGQIDAHEGRPLELDAGTAQELQSAGLVRFPNALPVQVAKGGSDAGKASDDGEGTPSSASQAALVLPVPTLKSSERGAKLTRKGAR
jgi:hypothetical protein